MSAEHGPLPPDATSDIASFDLQQAHHRKHGCLKGCAALAVPTLLATGICLWETDGLFSDVDIIGSGLRMRDQNHVAVVIPPLPENWFEFQMAEQFLPIIECDSDEKFEKGDYGVVFQVTPITEEQFVQHFKTPVRFSDNPHTLVEYGFVYIQDNGTRTANVIIANKISLPLTEAAFRDLNKIVEEDLVYDHFGDIETVAIITEQTGEEQHLLYLLIKRHNNGWELYTARQLRLLNNHPFLAKAEKNSLFISKEDVEQSSVHTLFLGPFRVLDFSGDVYGNGQILEFELPPPTDELPWSHNVGDYTNQLNPFLTSPYLTKFRNIDPWARRPFGNKFSNFKWLKIQNPE